MPYVYPKLKIAREIAKRLGAEVYSADRAPYKLMAVYKGRKIYFGDRNYPKDYLTTGDKAQRERYRKRHQKDRINDPTKPGYWSWRIIWKL